MGFNWLDVFWLFLGYVGGLLTPFIALWFLILHRSWVDFVRDYRRKNELGQVRKRAD